MIDAPMPQIDPSALLDFQEEMLAEVSRACNLTREEHARLIGARQCGSCGAYQDFRGDLPCGH